MLFLTLDTRGRAESVLRTTQTPLIKSFIYLLFMEITLRCSVMHYYKRNSSTRTAKFLINQEKRLNTEYGRSKKEKKRGKKSSCTLQDRGTIESDVTYK